MNLYRANYKLKVLKEWSTKLIIASDAKKAIDEIVSYGVENSYDVKLIEADISIVILDND